MKGASNQKRLGDTGVVAISASLCCGSTAVDSVNVSHEPLISSSTYFIPMQHYKKSLFVNLNLSHVFGSYQVQASAGLPNISIDFFNTYFQSFL
jgi:hypothetical protein